MNSKKSEMNLRNALRFKKQDIGYIYRTPSIKTILNLVCSNMNISQEEIQKKTNKREIVEVRQIAMYLAKEYSGLSPSKIGEEIADRDRCTVLHACNVVKNMRQTNKAYAERLEELEKLFKIG